MAKTLALETPSSVHKVGAVGATSLLGLGFSMELGSFMGWKGIMPWVLRWERAPLVKG